MERSKFAALLWGWSESFWEMWRAEAEVGEAGWGENGYTGKKVHFSTPSQNDSWAAWASQIDLYLTEKEDLKVLFFFFLKQPVFQWRLCIYRHSSKTRSSDGQLCRRIITWCGGGKGSAWILLPAGSTSFPLDCSLNAVTNFKDIWLHCHSRGMKLSFSVSWLQGEEDFSNFTIKLDFLAW